jgi:TPR repeat protein
MMAVSAGNILVARKDRIIEKLLAQCRLNRVEFNEILRRESLWQIVCRGGARKAGKDQSMRSIAISLALLANPAFADLEDARDLMEAGRFEQAYEALWPAARSGNAEAEELIGVMYAMGLGRPQDDQRAFEWYLRAAMKGHPGAQSGVGWYYEIGRGLPAPDLVRAYMWYTLSAIGGDPDAAISLEEVVKKMTAEEIEKAHILVADYKVWMYPFR